MSKKSNMTTNFGNGRGGFWGVGHADSEDTHLVEVWKKCEFCNSTGLARVADCDHDWKLRDYNYSTQTVYRYCTKCDKIESTTMLDTFFAWAENRSLNRSP